MLRPSGLLVLGVGKDLGQELDIEAVEQPAALDLGLDVEQARQALRAQTLEERDDHARVGIL